MPCSAFYPAACPLCLRVPPGGYAYRLCPASEALTEGCFQRTPLDFEGNSVMRWDGESMVDHMLLDGLTNSVWQARPMKHNKMSNGYIFSNF